MSEKQSGESSDSRDATAEAHATTSLGGGAQPEIRTDLGDDSNNDTNGFLPEDADIVSDPRSLDWWEYFPYRDSEPYDQQIDGVQRALDVFGENGYLMLEGACGTGKTLLALIAGIHAIRDADTISEVEGGAAAPERVFAATSVKPQLKQFIEDLRAINQTRAAQGKDTVSGIALRGKTDMLPYAREETGPFGNPDEDRSTQELSDDMRELTAEIIRRGSDFPLKAPSSISYQGSATGSWTPVPDDKTEDEMPWFDPLRAQALVAHIEKMDGDRLRTGGAKAPYPDEVPTGSEIYDRNATEGAEVPDRFAGYIDPFYAAIFVSESVPVGFSAGTHHVLTGSEIVSSSVKHGVCPHRVMSTLLEEATVIIGNYYHLFDPQTRHLTDKVIDEDTLAVVDEAHMLEDRLRDALSDEISLHDLKRAYNDINVALNILDGNHTSAEEAAEGLTAQEIAGEVLRMQEDVSVAQLNRNHLEAVQELFNWVAQEMDVIVSEYLDDEYDVGLEAADDRNQLPYQDSIAVQDPEEDVEDRITQDAIAADDLPMESWTLAAEVGVAVEEIFDSLDGVDRHGIAGTVGFILSKWRSASNQEYFREINLEYSPKGQNRDPEWLKKFNASLHLYNCIPSDRLAETFAELGGGILMSATLKPFDVFKRTSGLQAVDRGEIRPAADSTHEPTEIEERPVRSVEYGLAFPEENRESLIVTGDPYTYKNRGDRVTDRTAMTDTRDTYADILEDVASGYGNTLVCMPSYSEATWAADVLSDSPEVSKPIRADESSDLEGTNDLLEWFFRGESKVLVTSTLGTVTEGVDYDGDKLHTCAVFGVAYPYMDDRVTAVEKAYERRFSDTGSDGFEMAVQVPALRKSRQAIGRVIRSPDETGVRLLVDERYAAGGWSVNDHLSEQEQREFSTVSPSRMSDAVTHFWEDQ